MPPRFRNLNSENEEIKLLPVLKDFFNDPHLIRSENTYAPFDYCSPTRSIELKTRNCLKDTYPDTMIGANKIEFARREHHNREFYFVFKFADGEIYYWKYDPSVYLESRRGGRTDRGYDERKDYYYIPTNLLISL